MSYCTVDDIIARHPEDQVKKLTQVSGSSSQIDIEKVQVAIDDASNLIDNKLCSRYVLPLESSGRLVKIAVDIAWYFIHRHRHDNEISKEVKESYSDAIVALDAIKSGKEVLIGAVELPSKTAAIKTNQKACDRVFTNDSLRRM